MSSPRCSSGGTSKLRDSCNACATSKIKCPKERPSCSRCESRGIRCQYSFTKRPGRKGENSISRTSNGNIASDSITLNNTDNDNDSIHSGDGDISRQTRHPSLGVLFMSGNPTPPSITPGNTTGINGYLHQTRPSVLSSPRLDDTPAQLDSSDPFFMLADFNAFPEFDPELDNFITSAIDPSFALPVPDSSSSNITQTQNDIASLLMPATSTNLNNGSSEPLSTADSISSSSTSSSASALSSSVLSLSAPAFSSSSVFSSSSTLSSSSALSSSSRLPLLASSVQFPGVADASSSGHLAQTLDILKTISSAQSSHINTLASPDTSSNASNADSSARIVLRENKQSIEAVNAIISSSSCNKDRFLLAVLSMIVLKILERYTAAAQVQPLETEVDWRPRFSNSIGSHNTSPDRKRALSCSHKSAMRHDDNGRKTMSAQLVLGELHRVQRLVNQLSQEFTRHREEGGHDTMVDSEKMTTTLVTVSTLAQLETDMRKSLYTLSTEIIDRLRQR